jgi:choline dehydrogenase-like flavoprotein
LTVCEDLPRKENVVDLDPTVRDVYGDYVARVTYANNQNDIAVGSFVASQLPRIGEAMLQAIGATGSVVSAQTPLTSFSVGPRFNVHQHGTMRMGLSPQRGVVNKCGQFWEVPNLFVADGSLFTTSGGYNPTHTIEALAHMVATCIAENGANLLSRNPHLIGLGAVPNTSPDAHPDLAPLVVTAAGAGVAAVAAGRRRAGKENAG